MARVLMGWELGANRGHITKILPIAERLLAEGHEVHLALQQIDSGGLNTDRRLRLWQAPVWPRLLASIARPSVTPAATMGDILSRLGLDRPGALAALVAGWDSLLAAIDPDFAIADFAPALLTAARGRIPTATIGTGFASPPGTMGRFPTWGGMKTAHDEDELLDIADADLAMSGRAALHGLPGLFAADHQLVMSFTELDPYAADRPPHAYVLPAVRESSSTPKGGQGDEIFGYFVRQLAPELALWEGLAASGKRVRIHMHDPAPAHLDRFRKLGLIFEPKPQSFDTIVARSRVVVSHGGHGFASASALAGLPQMIVAFDLEKYLVGSGVRNARLGIDHNLFTLQPPAFGQALADLWADESLARDCRTLAAELLVRELPAPEEEMARLVGATK